MYVVCVVGVLQLIGSEASVDESEEHIFWMCRSRGYVQVEVLLFLVRFVVDLAEWSDGDS